MLFHVSATIPSLATPSKADTARTLWICAAENAEGENALGENAEGENALGEKAEGAKASGLKALGEKALGEKALGLNALGEKAEGEKALGLNALGLKALGLKASGEKALGLNPSLANSALIWTRSSGEVSWLYAPAMSRKSTRSKFSGRSVSVTITLLPGCTWNLNQRDWSSALRHCCALA